MADPTAPQAPAITPAPAVAPAVPPAQGLADPPQGEPDIEALKAEGDLTVGDNEPYQGALKGDVIDRHALRRGGPGAAGPSRCHADPCR